MQSLIRPQFKRKRFVEVSNVNEPPKVLTTVPCLQHGNVVDVVTFKKPEKEKEVPYSAYTADKVYDMGIVTPISLFNNLNSADKLELVSQIESGINASIESVNKNSQNS